MQPIRVTFKMASMLKWSPARKTSDAEPIRAVKHITLPTRPVTTRPTTSSKAPNAKRIRLKRETIRHDAPPPSRAASAEQRQRAAEPAPKVHRHQETPRKPQATLIRYDVLPARLPICHVHTSQPRSHVFSLESRKPIVPFGNHVTRGSLRLTSTSTKTVSAAQPDTTQHTATQPQSAVTLHLTQTFTIASVASHFPHHVTTTPTDTFASSDPPPTSLIPIQETPSSNTDMTDASKAAKQKSPLRDDLQTRNQGIVLVPEKYRPKGGGESAQITDEGGVGKEGRGHRCDRGVGEVPEWERLVPEEYRPRDEGAAMGVRDGVQSAQAHERLQGSLLRPKSVVRRFEECLGGSSVTQELLGRKQKNSNER